MYNIAKDNGLLGTLDEINEETLKMQADCLKIYAGTVSDSRTAITLHGIARLYDIISNEGLTKWNQEKIKSKWHETILRLDKLMLHKAQLNEKIFTMGVALGLEGLIENKTFVDLKEKIPSVKINSIKNIMDKYEPIIEAELRKIRNS